MDSDNHCGASSLPPVEGYVPGPPGRPATWEDIVNLPENLHAEVVNGRVHYRLTARGQHGHAVGEIFSAVRRSAGQGGGDGWWILLDAGFDIGHGSFVGPDLAGIRKARCPEFPTGFPIRLVPDWVCEVLSPSNAHYDRGDKAEAYAKAGVPWYWIVDADERTVEVLELVNGRWQIFGVYTDGAVVALPPFEDVTLTVSEIFVPKKAAAPG
ncbi:MAG: Uma2 family endonuclease [Deltaproteobacteria bacterium]|nr:Uma2 family endonuclease [Deltaproteobacteria bacterium]